MLSKQMICKIYRQYTGVYIYVYINAFINEWINE